MAEASFPGRCFFRVTRIIQILFPEVSDGLNPLQSVFNGINYYIGNNCSSVVNVIAFFFTAVAILQTVSR